MAVPLLWSKAATPPRHEWVESCPYVVQEASMPFYAVFVALLAFSPVIGGLVAAVINAHAGSIREHRFEMSDIGAVSGTAPFR